MSAEAIGIAIKVVDRLSKFNLKDSLSEEEYQIVEEVTRDLTTLTLRLAAIPDEDKEARSKLIIEMNHCRSTLNSYNSLKKLHTYDKITSTLADVLMIAARGAILLL